MMTLKKYLLLVLAVGYSFNSCDVIEEPFLVEKEVSAIFVMPLFFRLKKIMLRKYF